jgi:signal transduction histidine kinase
MGRRVARNVPLILAASAGLVLLVAGTTGWLGWRLLSQEETLLRQRSKDRLEQAADALLAGFLRTVADTESWLGQISSIFPADADGPARRGGTLLMFSGRGVHTQPAGVLPYLPVSPPSVAVDAAIFQPSERLEFQLRDLHGAATLLTELAGRGQRLVRAEALLRLARVQAKAGHIDQALDTYRRLRDESLIGPAEAPYSLLSRFARVQLLADSNRQTAARQEARELLTDMQSARFAVGKETFAWYQSAARKLSNEPPSTSAAPGLGLAVAEVVEAIWSEWQIFQRSGSRTMSKRLHVSTPVAVVAVLHATPDRLVALIHAGESIRSFGLDPAANGGEQPFRVTLLDERGARISGAELRSSQPRATRILSAAGLPWSLSLESPNEESDEGLLAARRMYFAAALAGVVLLVCAACYAIARGVLREAAAGRLQSDFVSAVSHEFRTPLTTLRQLTELLAHGRVQDEGRRRQYFDVLQKETSRLHQLVEDLLDFGRMDAGRRQYRLEPVDLSALVRESIEEYQRDAGGKGHRIELTSNPAPLVVDADREALGRVIRNLLENAVKYSPDSPTVWVETGHEPRAAVLRVRDQGIGIPAEEHARIFDKFVRGEGAKRTCIQGTGIGLAMVKEIVEVHRGDVHLSSEVGQGSTFMVRLPLRRAATESVV